MRTGSTQAHAIARRTKRAFTIVELLTVIAIIGLLAAILIPSVASARAAADRAKTRVQFNQWAVALEAFRSEYGFYPLLDPSHLVNGGADFTHHLFHDVLAGRKRDGSNLTAGTVAAAQNRKNIPFITFSESDFTETTASDGGLLREAFGATEIAVLVDRNLDGVINATDHGSNLPEVAGIRPSLTDFPPTGIRAGCVFYCAEAGATADAPKFILSWK